MQVSNQKPVELSPVYKSSITGPFDPMEKLKAVLATPLFAPINPNHPVTFTANGKTITDNEIAALITDCLGNTMNMTAEAACKEIYGKTLLNFDAKNPIGMKELFAIQSGTAAKLPPPSGNTFYTPAIDIIPAAKHFLSGKATYDELFANFAYYTRCNLLGFYFANDIAFDDFKAWFQTQHNTLSATLSPDVNKLCTQFMALNLNGLTESLRIRNDESDGNDEGSFPRLLIALLMQYVSQVSPNEFGIFPFDAGELFCPLSVVFVNIEKHARATAKEIADEWNIINKASKMPIKVVSNKKLTKMTATVRNLQKIAANASNPLFGGSGTQTQRAARVRFKKSPPTVVDMFRLVKRVIDKMAFVARSENSYKQIKMTYARPNRRDPDNFNKQGKTVSTKYKPDIHLYVDTSGSISEQNYQDTVKTCIRLAHKLNINLYFNSFSHVMSQTTHLHTRDKTMKQVYAEFQKIPKVTGGTDYEQIWEFINKNAKRKRELSIIVTDFEWTAPNHFIGHPKNLYYVPCSQMNWDTITSYAERFCSSMQHIDINIRKHLLF